MALEKDGTIVINEWQTGIGESPYTGLADVRNCEIHNPKGILKIALAPTKISATTVTALPTWSTSQTESDYFFGGYKDDTNVYHIDVSTVSAIATGSFSGGTSGGAYFKNYLVVVDQGNDTVDAYGPLTGTPAWTDNVVDIATVPVNTTTPVIWSQDDILYGSAGHTIWSLEENSGQTFDPTSGATFTGTSLALNTIPDDFVVESLVDFGSNLAIGFSRLRGGILFEGRDGRLAQWDRAASDTDLEIQLEEGGVRQIISRNGQMLLANGRHGVHVVTNGSLTENMPTIGLLTNLDSRADGETFPEARAYVSGEYLFGVSTADTRFTPAGVYGFKDGAWRFLEISTGEVGANDNLYIGVIKKKDNNKFFVGWQDDQNAAYGIDEFGYEGYRYTGYRARVDTQIYQVGGTIDKKSYQQLEIQLAKELATGEGIRVSYRKDVNDSFTVIGTYDYATYGAVSQINDTAKITDASILQFRIEMTTGANSTSSPELISLRVF